MREPLQARDHCVLRTYTCIEGEGKWQLGTGFETKIGIWLCIGIHSTNSNVHPNNYMMDRLRILRGESPRQHRRAGPSLVMRLPGCSEPSQRGRGYRKFSSKFSFIRVSFDTAVMLRKARPRRRCRPQRKVYRQVPCRVPKTPLPFLKLRSLFPSTDIEDRGWAKGLVLGR